jgi:putative lipoic acid-binding regulatory protein
MTNKDDTAGPMLGWSVGTGVDTKAIRDLLDLPCTYSFKAIGEVSEAYQAALLLDVGRQLGRTLEPKDYSVRTSGAGKYVSITFHLYMTTPEEIFEMYAVLKANPGTRFIL